MHRTQTYSNHLQAKHPQVNNTDIAANIVNNVDENDFDDEREIQDEDEADNQEGIVWNDLDQEEVKKKGCNDHFRNACIQQCCALYCN